MASNRFGGLCAGGPLNGQMIVSEYPKFLVPLLPRAIPLKPPNESVKVSSGEYRFNNAVKMWIWRGPWPLKT